MVQGVLGESSSETCFAELSSTTDTDWEATSPCPQFTLPSDSSDEGAEKIGGSSDIFSSPNAFVSGYFESPDLGTEEPLLHIVDGSELDLVSFMALEENQLLSQDERAELYDLINDSVDGRTGLHSASFAAGSRTYSDNIQSMQRRARPNRPDLLANKTATTSCDANMYDLLKWLSDDLDLYQPTLEAHDYHPARDSLDGPYGLNDLSVGGGASSHGVLVHPVSPCRPRNRAYTLTTSNSVEGVTQVWSSWLYTLSLRLTSDIKNVLGASKADRENVNPTAN